MPSSRTRPPARPRRRASPALPAPAPLDAGGLAALQAALDEVPAPLEPLDPAAIDGLLCAALVQPAPVPRAGWLPLVLDLEGRPVPPTWDASPIASRVARREAELRSAIARRAWFDPWLFESDQAAGAAEPWRALVAPWIAGFAIGFESFPALREQGGAELLEPLALLYRHFDPDDLEDADDLLAAIDEIGPATSAEDAVEGLVRATLLLADAADAVRDAR